MIPPADHRERSGLVASLLPILFFAAAAVAMTWPLARDIRTADPDHDDAYYGIWRMAWVARQLPRAPLHLFDANIFVPTPNTLALSDAALLQGLVAAPPLWLGASPVVVYNLLLLASLGLSAWCAYLLAMRVTGGQGPSLLAGFVLGFGPYRLAQLGHLDPPRIGRVGQIDRNAPRITAISAFTATLSRPYFLPASTCQR